MDRDITVASMEEHGQVWIFQLLMNIARECLGNWQLWEIHPVMGPPNPLSKTPTQIQLYILYQMVLASVHKEPRMYI